MTPQLHGLSPAQRLLVTGGLLLVVLGLCSGEWFALFVSHVLNAQLREVWSSILDLASRGASAELQAALERLQGIASERGRAMSLHSHIGSYGVLAAMVALYARTFHARGVSLATVDAALILAGAVLLSLGMYWPGPSIMGLLSFSDLGVPVLAAGLALLFFRSLRAFREGSAEANAPAGSVWDVGEPHLFRLGCLLIGIGLIFGMYVAWRHIMYEQPALAAAFADMVQSLASGSMDRAAAAFAEYKKVQTRIDITAASHSHAVLFGILILIVANVLRAANLSAPFAMAARVLAVAGGFLLPVFVYLAPRYGFTFALFADGAGALMILALVIVLKGLVMNASAAQETSK